MLGRLFNLHLSSCWQLIHLASSQATLQPLSFLGKDNKDRMLHSTEKPNKKYVTIMIVGLHPKQAISTVQRALEQFGFSQQIPPAKLCKNFLRGK